MKTLLTYALLQCLSLLSLAHEFWMQPVTYQYAMGESAGIDFMVGENFEGNRWSVKPGRIQRLEHHTAASFKMIMLPADTSKRPVLSVKLEKAGIQLIVMQSSNAFIELEADKFNAYLKEDGLDDAMNQRMKTNSMNKSAREHYQRNTKLLLQCGELNDEGYRKKAGLPLEIIPLDNPYSAKQGDELRFRLLFQDKPHSFALVKVWNKKEGRTFMQNVYTDKEGIITTRLSGRGSWMISSVKMVPSNDPSADWQSYWGSLVFGYK